jgi:hypothetical protein
MKTITQLLQMHETGAITHAELINRLIDLASETLPEDYIPLLAPSLATAIRQVELVQHPPATADENLNLGSVVDGQGTDIAAAVKREQQRTFRALHALHRYFQTVAPGAGDR